MSCISATLVHVDKTSHVLMVHLTAKTFLQNQGLDSPLAICPVLGYQEIARTGLEYLISDDFKPPKGRWSSEKVKKRVSQQKRPFVSYATFNFAEHLRRTTSNNIFITPLLLALFQKNVFTWIETVARDKRPAYPNPHRRCDQKLPPEATQILPTSWETNQAHRNVGY